MHDDIPLIVKGGDNITPGLMQKTKASRRKFRGVINNYYELVRNMIVPVTPVEQEPADNLPVVSIDKSAIEIPLKLEKLGVDLQSGAELVLEDCRQDNYPKESVYIVFPPSWYNVIFGYSIGFIELHNTGTEPIGLVSWKRKSTNGSPTHFFLQPDQVSLFDFKGHWCIQILHGNNQSLKVLDFNTFGGTGNYNNLNMV